INQISMPRPPRGQSPRSMLMKLNATSGPNAFHHPESSDLSLVGSFISGSGGDNFFAFFDRRSSIIERTLQIKKQAQKAFSVLAAELRIRVRMARNRKRPAIFAKVNLR